MKASGTTVARLRKFRAARRNSLAKRAGVVGSGLGYKLRGGVATGEPAVVVLVKSKQPDNQLADGARIPRTLRVAGRTVQTDVVEIGSLTQQAGRYCFDGAHLGVVSAFATDGALLYGVTCAHCMQGPAGTEQQPVPMAIERANRKGYEVVGQSGYCIVGAGSGVPGDFGFADAGLFSLSLAHSRKLIPRQVRLPSAEIEVDMKVFGVTGHGDLRGTVALVEAEYDRVLCDALIRLDGPGTYPGDSGMMWFNSRGQAIGLHALGSDPGPFGGSVYSAVMFKERVEYYLGVDLLST